MSNREWMLLIAKEFNVSNTMAKRMLSAMYTVKRYLSVPETKNKKEKDKQDFEKIYAEEDF